MKEFFDGQKRAITNFLTQLLMKKNEDLQRVHSMGADSVNRILDFTSRGKMLRGGLVSLAYLLTRGEERNRAMFLPEKVTAAGAAMELFQSGFLIHDDIMDRDEMRRGGASVFSQYGKIAAERNFPDSYHTGESIGICVGDIAFFIAFEVLGGISRTGEGDSLIELSARELSYVGVAQMLDVYWGQEKGNIKEEEVFGLYRYKTGRYTFSLPLVSGAVLAGAKEDQIELLDRIGELLGVVFQLKDDELGLFGDEKQLGKPIGSDLREGKKTPFFLRLISRADSGERDRLTALLGSERVSAVDVEYVRDLMRGYGIRDEILGICRDYAERARSLINDLKDVDPEYRRILTELLEYSLNRER
jgi:geranylgeranyl diphosphate synthase type I